jgi:hypothetical protein
MRVVDATATELERFLLAGRLDCPACRGMLRPWGRARSRVVRSPGGSGITVRPRRARCSGCGATHVLLPGWMLPRRAYAAPVIRDVLMAHANGLGYRRIALRHGLPEMTVRDWLRALRTPTRAHPTSPVWCAQVRRHGSADTGEPGERPGTNRERRGT